MHTNEQQTIVRKVVVLNKKGLHARPAAKLVEEAQRFSSSIELVLNGQKADGKSILDILTLAAGPGCGLEIHASGNDAQKAADHLSEFFRSSIGGL